MTEDQPRPWKPGSAQLTVAACIVVLTAGVVAYHLFHGSPLKQTALFYIGLPALLAIALVLMRPASTITGTIVKALTIGLLLSPMVLREGVICVLIAAPLFYAVGVGIGLIADWSRRQGDAARKRSALLLLPLGVLMLEGATPATTLPAAATVTVEQTIDATGDEVRGALAARPCFTTVRPWTLRKFPELDSATGSGLAVGDRRVMAFTGPHGSGSLTLRVAESRPGSVRFAVVSDDSPMATWWGLRESVVRWSATGDGRTAVTWTLRYDRRLAPAAYFGPVERLVAGEAARYLIDAVATPREC